MTTLQVVETSVTVISVADPDLQIRGGAPVSKKIFSVLWASFWSKNRGVGWAPLVPPLDPPLNLELYLPIDHNQPSFYYY